jgi:alpha-glucuronidase
MIVNNTTKNTGYDAWLGYGTSNPADLKNISAYFSSICAESDDPVVLTAERELKAAIRKIFGRTPVSVDKPKTSGTVVLGIIPQGPSLQPGPDSGKSACLSCITDQEAERIGSEGFIIKHCVSDNGSISENSTCHLTIIAAKSGAGVLYGVFALIRRIMCGEFNDSMNIIENPSLALRIIDQWDNMDGSIERGYAGLSIFYRNGRILTGSRRIRDYARLLASVGINSIVLNNVNVHRTETRLISMEQLPKVAKLAAVFRSYGIRILLSINYSSPIELGGLGTADPLDKEVQAWWKAQAAEIYRFIPDFGGFLVKADSEFRPGPFTYGRDHAQGANMLAAALKPFGGIVIWRCFVYNCRQDWRDTITDRANSAYDTYMPLDGRFEDNVLLQIKNGPMDFQVREPVSPLLGGLRKSNMILELQITQEYTGQQRHLCYLAPMWKDVLDFDTFNDGKGSTVANILVRSGQNGKLSGIAAVSNIGDDLNWTGHDLAQANLYCYGRLTWDPSLTSEEIAREWVVQTFGSDPVVVDTITGMLMDSYSIYESYTAPLGIGWMVNPSHHYGPSVDGYEYSAWGTYHRADHEGIGVDRSVAAGTGNAGRYFPPNSAMYEKPETCPEELLLFFHHVPYKYRLKSGTTLIQHIYDTHFEGAERAAGLIDRWKSLDGRIGSECSERVLKRLEEQAAHACEWRDVINSYFFRKSGIPDERSRKIY